MQILYIQYLFNIQAEYSQYKAFIWLVYVSCTDNIEEYPDIMQSVYSLLISNKHSV